MSVLPLSHFVLTGFVFFLPSFQHFWFLILITPLLPLPVHCFGPLFLSLSWQVFAFLHLFFVCSLRFCSLLPACPHPFLTLFLGQGMWIHMHALYTCLTHMHTHALTWRPSLALVCCSWRPPQWPQVLLLPSLHVAGFWEETFRWRRNRKGSRQWLPACTWQCVPGGRLDWADQDKGPWEAPASEAQEVTGLDSRKSAKKDKGLRWLPSGCESENPDGVQSDLDRMELWWRIRRQRCEPRVWRGTGTLWLSSSC